MIDVNKLPDVELINVDPERNLNEMINTYEQVFFELTNQKATLTNTDPIRIMFLATNLLLTQIMVKANDIAKQNLLKYARTSNLDHLGAFNKTERIPSQQAKTLMKFNLSVAQTQNIYIPEGTRVSPDNQLYFETVKEELISAGATFVENIEVRAIEGGVIYNNLIPGQINILVDPLPYVATVENTVTSYGGTDVESDDKFRERIALAPEGFSVAGPSAAYEYFIKSANSNVLDIHSINSDDAVLELYILLENGELPSQEELNDIYSFLTDNPIRPLTDKIEILAPIPTSYNLNITYYLNEEDRANEAELRNSIEQAFNNYKVWQRSKIGRNINPSKAIHFGISSGAKRVEITSPSYTEIEENELAIPNNVSIQFGGYEND